MKKVRGQLGGRFWVVVLTIALVPIVGVSVCHLPALNKQSSGNTKANSVPKKEYFRVKIAGSLPVECSLGNSDDFLDVLPCAWRQAQIEASAYAPTYEQDFYKLGRPKIKTYNKFIKLKKDSKEYAGLTYPDKNPPVHVTITGDKDYDYDTLVHEFLHFLFMNSTMPNNEVEKADAWVDALPYPRR